MSLFVLSTLQTSEIIDLFGIIASIFLSLVAIVIAVLTLRQNSKMLEESTRPYICITFDIIKLSSQIPRFIIKNYGQTGACITDFQYPEIFKTCDFGASHFNKQFDLVKGLFLAPQQSFTISIFKVPEEINDVEFTISYKANKKNYKEIIKLNVGDSPLHYMLRPSVDNGKELNSIAHSLQALCERHE